MASPVTKICLYCGQPFTTTRTWTKYCPGTDHQRLMWLDAYREAGKAMAAKSISSQ